MSEMREFEKMLKKYKPWQPSKKLLREIDALIKKLDEEAANTLKLEEEKALDQQEEQQH